MAGRKFAGANPKVIGTIVDAYISTAAWGAGFNAMLNSPEAPVKSRFQIECPGSVSSAG